MGSTHEKVRDLPERKRPDHSAESAADGVGEALKILEGRWKMVIIFQLFASGVLRFSELERAIPAVSQKMLSQHLRELERDGVVQRTVYPVVPPRVEYGLTELGKALCPALDALLHWTELRRGSAARSAVVEQES